MRRQYYGLLRQYWREVDPSPPSSAVGHERVELHLYSPCGTYGLYRASVPVQGCALPLLLPLPKWRDLIFISVMQCTATFYGKRAI